MIVIDHGDHTTTMAMDTRIRSERDRGKEDGIERGGNEDGHGVHRDIRVIRVTAKGHRGGNGEREEVGDRK